MTPLILAALLTLLPMPVVRQDAPAPALTPSISPSVTLAPKSYIMYDITNAQLQSMTIVNPDGSKVASFSVDANGVYTQTFPVISASTAPSASPQ